MPTNPAIVEPRDTAEAEKKTANTRLQNAKQDMLALIGTLAPLYDDLTPTQRNAMIATFESWGNDPQSVTAAQKDNALGFAAALFSIAIDYLHRNGT